MGSNCSIIPIPLKKKWIWIYFTDITDIYWHFFYFCIRHLLSFNCTTQNHDRKYSTFKEQDGFSVTVINGYFLKGAPDQTRSLYRTWPYWCKSTLPSWQAFNEVWVAKNICYLTHCHGWTRKYWSQSLNHRLPRQSNHNNDLSEVPEGKGIEIGLPFCQGAR